MPNIQNPTYFYSIDSKLSQFHSIAHQICVIPSPYAIFVYIRDYDNCCWWDHVKPELEWGEVKIISWIIVL